jgi:hypothetical protein
MEDQTQNNLRQKAFKSMDVFSGQLPAKKPQAMLSSGTENKIEKTNNTPGPDLMRAIEKLKEKHTEQDIVQIMNRLAVTRQQDAKADNTFSPKIQPSMSLNSKISSNIDTNNHSDTEQKMPESIALPGLTNNIPKSTDQHATGYMTRPIPEPSESLTNIFAAAESVVKPTDVPMVNNQNNADHAPSVQKDTVAKSRNSHNILWIALSVLLGILLAAGVVYLNKNTELFGKKTTTPESSKSSASPSPTVSATPTKPVVSSSAKPSSSTAPVTTTLESELSALEQLSAGLTPGDITDAALGL